VQRDYDNVEVPGLGVQVALEARMGVADPAGRGPWTQTGGPGLVRLPDRRPEEAWPAAQAKLRQRVGDDCRRASEAQHLRELYVQLRSEQAAWTWMLLPAWSTWYADDEGRVHVLWVDGTTGRAGGPRMSSPVRGRRVALGLGIAALVLGAGALAVGLVGVVLWPLLAVAALLVLVALGLAVGALVPLLQPARWNAGQAGATPAR
jgi:hypothetical protein